MKIYIIVRTIRNGQLVDKNESFSREEFALTSKETRVTLGRAAHNLIKLDSPFIADQQGILTISKRFLRKPKLTYTDTSAQGTLVGAYDLKSDHLQELTQATLLHQRTLPIYSGRTALIITNEKNECGFALIPVLF